MQPPRTPRLADVRTAWPRRMAAITITFLLAACASSVGDAGPLHSPTTTGGSASTAAPAPKSPTPTGAEPSAPSKTAAIPAASSPLSPSTPTAAPSGAQTTTLSIYLLQGDTLVPVYRQVPHTVAVARAAMQALLAGPTSSEASGPHALGTLIPAGTALLDISVSGGVATVDLTSEYQTGGGSASMFGRLAQVVYTLTQFPSVTGVRFRLDGQPVTVFSGEGIVLDGASTRDDYRDYLPPIFLERPPWGGQLSAPARFTGIANVFEAQFTVEVAAADGTVLARSNVRASCGTGCWGTFDVTLPLVVTRRQPGSVTVYDLSPRDGTREHVRTYPVTLVPAS